MSCWLFRAQSVQSALFHDVHHTGLAASSILGSTILRWTRRHSIIGDSEAAQRGGVRLLPRRADAGEDKGAKNIAECRLPSHTRAQPLGPERWREARPDQVQSVSRWCTAGAAAWDQDRGQPGSPLCQLTFKESDASPAVDNLELYPLQNAGQRWRRCMRSCPGSRWGTFSSLIWWRFC